MDRTTDAGNNVELDYAVQSLGYSHDPLKRDYLLSLNHIDRANLERVVGTLGSRMPEGTRILAGGSSVMKNDRPHKDIDLSVFGNPESIPSLSQDAYRIVSQIEDFKVEGRPAWRIGGIISYLVARRFPMVTNNINYFTLTPPQGRTFDLFISPIPYGEHFKRSPLPYIILH